jgi:proteasome accessory factor A
MQRLFGIETEYGITIDGIEEIDTVAESIELIKNYRYDYDFTSASTTTKWDYSLEDPFKDARGFRAEELQEHPDEVKHQEEDRRRKLSFEEVKSDRVLINGARLYNDHAHPEYSTPECNNLFELIAHDKAGERILQQCARRLSVAKSREAGRSEQLNDKTVVLYKNNTDFHGHSYGCHDNYCMSRDVPFDYIKNSIMPFFVTRQIFAGAGKVGIETESGLYSAGFFQLSQRADFFTVEVSVDTMSRRPIINTRDEPHADPKKYRRLHVIVGDANMSEYATALKIGTTALVIDLIEKQLIPRELILTNPVKDIKEISRDQMYQWQVKLNDGRTISAIDIQRQYLSLAQKHLSGRDYDTDWVLAEWEDVLNKLERDPASLFDRLDWAAKKWLLEEFIESEKLTWDDPWLQSIDLEYHNIDTESGLYYELLRKGIMRRVITDEQIHHAIFHPPGGTRAYFRGKSLEKFRPYVKSVQWDSITFEMNGRQFPISMNNLIDNDSVKKYNEFIDNSETLAEMLSKL